jgi:hypothetical protein
MGRLQPFRSYGDFSCKGDEDGVGKAMTARPDVVTLPFTRDDGSTLDGIVLGTDGRKS